MMRPQGRFILTCFIVSLFNALSFCSSDSSLALPFESLQKLHPAHDFSHDVGQKGERGWELDYKRDRPGYALRGLNDSLLLEPGLYRVTFILRRGHYPKKGLLYNTSGIFRLELWDRTADKLLNKRDLQIGDFSEPNRYERRWMDFSMREREGHAIEPRVYWIGLANGEVGGVEIERFPQPSLEGLEKKALRLGEQLERRHLENGFVVSRKLDGEVDETGDATTYTSFYVASLAWKHAVTKDEFTYQALENGLQTLHRTIKGTFDEPVLTRFVDQEGVPYFKSPSKDVYTAFFFAYSAAFPMINNPALKRQMAQDMERLTNHLLKDDLKLRLGSQAILSLTPYYTEEELRSGIKELLSDKKLTKKFLKGLKQASRYVPPLSEPWPTMREVKRALHRQDEDELVRLTVPTLNGLLDLMVRVRDLLREQYRDDLFPKRFRNQDYPGRKLSFLLTDVLKKVSSQKAGRRFQRLSDLRVLASNALIVLHLVQTAREITKKPQFEDYYKSNLYTQEALLSTALDWYNAEEDLISLMAGNAAAERLRAGYLSALSLYNLIQIETNPAVKEKYQEILNRWWASYRNEDNPMAMAIQYVCSNNKEADIDLIFRCLELYPEDRKGFGNAHWAAQGQRIAEELGGGLNHGFSREPLPVSHRPKDSFLWQRNSRRLKGDDEKEYPGTEFLFLYWFCRYHDILPAPSKPTSVYQREKTKP